MKDQDLRVELLLGKGSYNGSLAGTVVNKQQQENVQMLNNRQEVVATPAIWKQINSNKTAVYLRVMLFRTSTAQSVARSIITSADLQSGEVLSGAVAMIKHDVVPRSFRYRYLLSDFGLVNATAQEGMQQPQQCNYLH